MHHNCFFCCLLILLLLLLLLLGSITESDSCCDRCYGSVVCMYVCLSVTLMLPAKAVGSSRCHLLRTLMWSQITLYQTRGPCSQTGRGDLGAEPQFSQMPPIPKNVAKLLWPLLLILILLLTVVSKKFVSLKDLCTLYR